MKQGQGTQELDPTRADFGDAVTLNISQIFQKIVLGYHYFAINLLKIVIEFFF